MAAPPERVGCGPAIGRRRCFGWAVPPHWICADSGHALGRRADRLGPDATPRLGERRDLSPTVSLSALLAGVDDVVTGSTTVGLTVSVGEIVAGGFPGPRHLEGRALTAQLDGYLSRIVTREFADAGHRRAPPGDAHWLVAGLRGSHGDYCSVGDHPRRRHRRVGHQAGPEHLDRLLGRVDGAGILDPTPAWSPSRNHLARLAASPKHHLADPALPVRLGAITPSCCVATNVGCRFPAVASCSERCSNHWQRSRSARMANEPMQTSPTCEPAVDIARSTSSPPASTRTVVETASRSCRWRCSARRATATLAPCTSMTLRPRP